MSLRVQKPGRARTTISHPDRPPIWTDGRQNPPFVLSAFARASLQGARESAARGLDLAGHRFSTDRRGGTVRPSQAVARLSLMCQRAAMAARGVDPGPDVTDLTATLAPAFQRAPAAPLPQAARRPIVDSDPTLSAIRRVLLEDSFLRPAATERPDRSGKSDLPPPSLRPDLPARGLAAVALVLCLPVGAGLALAAHLSGEDLREAG